MKHVNSASLLAGGLLLLNICAFSQTTTPVSLQRKLNGKTQSPGALVQKMNPTLSTFASPSPSVKLTDKKDVRIFPSSHVQAEVMIVLDKNNAQNLLAAANTLLGPFGYNQGFYSSSDGGATWTGADSLQNISPTKIDGDPSVAFAADGTAFMTTIAGGNFGTAGYWFQKSTDGGKNWSTGIKGDKGLNFDKGMIAADNLTTSPYANNFYSSWTDFNSGNGAVAFNRSTDKGTTFSAKIQLRSGTVGFGQGTNVQTGPDGEVYVCWADHKDVVSPFKADGMGFAKSVNGGVSFTPAAVVFPYRGTRVDNTDATYNFTRVNDFPSMAVDKSHTVRRGRIYITYPEANATNGRSEIKVRYSDDGGTTWSGGSVVNIPAARQSFFPWVTVDDKYGIVWVVYYAFDQATGYATNTYVAASQDGTTWLNQKASDVSHTTAAIDNTNFAAGYAGDYIGIAAYNGVAHPTWMDDRNGTWQVYTSAVVGSRTLAGATEATTPVALKANMLTVHPNPASTMLHINLSGAAIKSVQLFYPAGTLAKEWNSGDMQTLSVANLQKGIYTLSVTDKDGRIYSQKIIKE